ncbi:hypothetical protein Psfp_04095 [Pelotomaculum sp. FP]|nr:hypothetical protein Psfp_04095 [Pelotomaculum sp. FP]
MTMALMNTQSAHRRSSSVTFLTFMSISRLSHAAGSMAATVNSPRGGNAAFLLTNDRAYLKLQKLSGYFGYTSNAFNCPISFGIP